MEKSPVLLQKKSSPVRFKTPSPNIQDENLFVSEQTKTNSGTLKPAAVLQLQRTIGNRAVQRLLAQRRTNPSQPISKAATKGIIQRNVGFEFEVGKYRVQQMKAAMTEEEKTGAQLIPEDGVDDGTLQKAAVLARKTGFELQVDEGNDDFHLEFVTTGAGFPETKDGRKDLKVAIEGMVSLGTSIMEKGNTDGPRKAIGTANRRAVPTNDIEGGLATDPQTVILSSGNPMEAEPQTTVGLRLDQLPALMENMVPRTGESAKEMDKRGVQRGTLAGKSVKADTDAMRGAAPAARLAIDNFKQQMALAGTPVPAGFGSASLVGFMALIYTYLKRAEMIVGAYPKSLFPLLGITDFGTMFGMLPTADKTPFTTTPQHFVDINLAAAGMTGAGGTAFFAGGFRHPMTNMTLLESQNAALALSAFTRQTWLTNIVHGVDQLTKASAHVDALESMGKFKKGEQVGQTHIFSKDTTTVAPILELRRMSGGVTIMNWKDMALDIFDFIVKLNDKKTTKFESDRYNAAKPKT